MTQAEATADVRGLARRVYRYWRNQGLSPEDARTQVGACMFSHFNERRAA